MASASRSAAAAAVAAVTGHLAVRPGPSAGKPGRSGRPGTRPGQQRRPVRSRWNPPGCAGLRLRPAPSRPAALRFRRTGFGTSGTIRGVGLDVVTGGAGVLDPVLVLDHQGAPGVVAGGFSVAQTG